MADNTDCCRGLGLIIYQKQCINGFKYMYEAYCTACAYGNDRNRMGTFENHGIQDVLRRHGLPLDWAILKKVRENLPFVDLDEYKVAFDTGVYSNISTAYEN